MEPSILLALRPCVLVPAAYDSPAQERWSVFTHEDEQLVRCLHGLSAADGGAPWSPHGLHPGLGYLGSGRGPRGDFPPTHPPPPPPRPNPLRTKGHEYPEPAYDMADRSGGSPARTPPQHVPQGHADHPPAPAYAAVIKPPFPVLPTPPRPGGRAPAAAGDDASPCQRAGRPPRTDSPREEDARRDPGLRRTYQQCPRAVRAEYEAGETPGDAEKRAPWLAW